ncbi:cadherin-like domain-containing protein [Enterovibrio coralii]|uniref:Uncharacterized protein n=1 Tax=Enterovibrio coralii TaxID=294935 RepID=A0A135IAU6_9GAMM|nr:Ig-like domain-containing protein [Enterovibrio coralii]KXF82577.1 hypothetical protein ATN88_24635 [Enterovibrio coralii]
MAVTLVLSQVVGQAFVVKPDGETVPAQPNVALQTGDVLSVPNGKNAWIVTEDQEQIDVLDEALFVGEEGIEGLDLPADVLDIIAAIEEGDDPTQKEGTETAAGEGAAGSALGAQSIIESNNARGGINSITGFDTQGLQDRGLSADQSDSLLNARYASLLSSQAQEDEYVAPVFSPITISFEEDGDITLSREDILPFITGGDTDNIQITNIIPSIEGATVIQNADGSFTLRPPEDFNGEMSFKVEISDGVTTTSGDVSVTVTSVEDAPEVELTAVPLTEDSNVSEGSVIANISTNDGDGDRLEVTITNDPNGYFAIEDGNVVLTAAGQAAIDDDTLALEEISVTVAVSDGKTTVEETVSVPITRTDDDAVVEGDTEATVSDPSGVAPGTASGVLNVVDIDSNNQTTLNNETIRGEYGTLVLENGAWTYTTDNDKVAPLAEGEQATDTFTVTASDGSEHQSF